MKKEVGKDLFSPVVEKFDRIKKIPIYEDE